MHKSESKVAQVDGFYVLLFFLLLFYMDMKDSWNKLPGIITFLTWLKIINIFYHIFVYIIKC